MTFRDREKERYKVVKSDSKLFSAAAQQPGTYNSRSRDFCQMPAPGAADFPKCIRNEHNLGLRRQEPGNLFMILSVKTVSITREL